MISIHNGKLKIKINKEKKNHILILKNIDKIER